MPQGGLRRVALWLGSHGKARCLEFSCGNAWPGSLWYGSLGLVVMVEFVAVGKAVYGLAVEVGIGALSYGRLRPGMAVMAVLVKVGKVLSGWVV